MCGVHCIYVLKYEFEKVLVLFDVLNSSTELKQEFMNVNNWASLVITEIKY